MFFHVKMNYVVTDIHPLGNEELVHLFCRVPGVKIKRKGRFL